MAVENLANVFTTTVFISALIPTVSRENDEECMFCDERYLGVSMQIQRSFKGKENWRLTLFQHRLVTGSDMSCRMVQTLAMST